MLEEFLWVEKYRPKTVATTILPDGLKQTFQTFVNQNNVPNLLLTGTAGVGKTTIAKAMLEELGCDYIVINGSDEGRLIDTLRTKIKGFASSMSLSGGRKYVILDEADYLNPQSTQPALRGFIEEFSDNCRFILTCNFKNRIIEPLHSRCGVYEFNITKKDLPELCGKFLQRSQMILKEENIEVPDTKLLAEVIMRFAPDWRRVLGELQRSSGSGVLDLSSLGSKANGNYDSLFASLKSKDFKKMRSWVSNNIDVDSSVIFRSIYDNMYEKADPSSIPQLVLILADYQYKNAFVADHELNMVACMTEIMANVEFK